MARLAALFGIVALATLTGSRLPSPNQISNGIGNSLALRQRYGISVPTSSSMIMVDSVVLHYMKSEYSTVAWQSADGSWEISRVGENGPGGLIRMDPELIPENHNRVADDDSARLNRLLSDKSLYSENSRFSAPKDAVGVGMHTMEITTPSNHVVVRWVGRLKGRAGKIADIVLGKG